MNRLFTCPRCRGDLSKLDNPKFCAECGWDLSKQVPVRELTSVKIEVKCPTCDTVIDNPVWNVPICTNCGTYLGFNHAEIDENLVTLAREWTGTTREYCLKILGLSGSTTHRLLRWKLTPIQVLALPKGTAQAIQSFGKASYDELDAARKKKMS